MEREFFEKKIRKLEDDNLIDLLKLTHNANHTIIQLATAEAKRRNLEVPQTEIESFDPGSASDKKTGDPKKLEHWNWGAFLLAPIWTLANGLEKWTMVCFIPVVNIVAIFYLGFNGNKLAFKKSNIDNVDDFMILQQQWNRWARRIFWISFIAFMIWLFME